MTYMLDTRDGYARRIITEGQRCGIAPRGIVIALATTIVESNVKVYANRAVPESMKLPHDAVGSDSKSVGLYQQQVRRGDNGEWWWGSAEECMSPERSSELFYERLKRKPYQWASSDLAAGSIAQEIQQSAFPDRYGQRMGEAQQLYDRLSGGVSVAKYYDSDRSGEFGFGRPRDVSKLVGVCVHTTESGKSATATTQTADDVTSYQIRTQTGSYNVMCGVDGKRILQNTDDWQTWSTGNKGNDILLHVCVVGNASQTRAEWLAQDKMLRAVGSVIGHWCRLYSWPIKKVDAAHLPGVLGHVDTRVWGGTDHTDPGPNFPYDVVLAYAQGTPTTDGGFLMALSDKEQRELLDKTRVIYDQLGPKHPSWGEESSFGKNAAGQERTMRDGIIAGLAELRKVVGK